MKFRSVVIYLLIGVFLAGVFMQAQGRLEIRAASSMAMAGWPQMPAPGGGTVWVSPANALTSADIARGEIRTQANGDRAVNIVFTPEGARKMAQLTAAHSNKPIALLLDGNVVWAPIVRATIENEALLTGVTPEVLERVLTSLKQ